MNMNMFEQRDEQQKLANAPLATRMRPTSLHTYVGQEHLIGKGKVLRRAIEADRIPSVIFWGPPGCGKTTLAFIIANGTGAFFAPVSAVSASVNDLRKIIQQAQERRKVHLQKTILFIDEIHRFNKAQQDTILPFVEDGTVILIGATTENPSFEVTSPLLSRSRVLPLKPLSGEEIQVLALRALKDKLQGIGGLNVEISSEAMSHLIAMSNNDARIALNTLETASLNTPPDERGKRTVSLSIIEDALQRRAVIYDKAGEQHYDLISALHKSMRDSDPDATVYWLTVMLEAGEDPLYIARRIVRFASEDVGLADPQALVQAMAAQQAVHFIGMPEANLALTQAAVYMATAPKSNSLYEAYNRVREEIKGGSSESVPMNLRNPVTPLMKEMGYGEDYKYAHDYPEHLVEQQHLPDAIKGKQFYRPGNLGFEQQVASRLKSLWKKAIRPSRPEDIDTEEPEPEEE
ncbi:MAG: replication-associated recombination protein A [Dehalococcoidales bacterium]|nr:replication-associated recombination protein A [Dehalococcoidales bacterium]